MPQARSWRAYPQTYRLEAGLPAQRYMDTVLAHWAIKEWMKAGRREEEIIAGFED